MENGYWFKSEKFEIEKGEDDETNLLCFGRSLANWLCQQFASIGYDAEVIPEDWGWCVMCSRDKYLLWVGCGIMQSENSMQNYDPDNPPKGNEVAWHAFTEIEVPFFMFKSLCRKWMGKLDLQSPIKKLTRELDDILKSEAGIHFCREP